MSKRMVLLTALLGASLVAHGIAVAAGSSGGSGKSYRWVDNKGVVHYGDSVPPEYASQGREELNTQAVPVRTLPKQLSPAEAAQAQQEAAETARRKQRDTSLLTTYTQLRDIEQLRDERLALIDSQMEMARQSLTSTNQRIANLEARIRNFQPYASNANARRLPDQLAQEAVQALKEQRSLLGTLKSRETERNALRQEFDADIARYRELTAPGHIR